MRVRDIMTTELATARPDTTFQELVDLMLRHDVSGVPVVDDDGKPVGVVTEADLVSKEAFGGRRRRPLEAIADLVMGGEVRWAIKGRGHRAEQVMTRKLITTHQGDRIEHAARTMLEAGVKRLPIVDADGRLVGIVTRSDLLRQLHRTDGQLREDVEALLADPLRSPERAEVSVAVDQGEITLCGTVEFPDDLPFVSALAWSIPGTVDVHNRVTARRERPRLTGM